MGPWHAEWIAKGQALLKLAAEILNVMIIPMPDYRPKYPKIHPEEVINPNHPNLTIWGNRIEVALFIGIHCHYATLPCEWCGPGPIASPSRFAMTFMKTPC